MVLQTACPICQQSQPYSFWYWEQEDSLMRAWSPDPNLHFVICRHCGAIYQDPPKAAEADWGLGTFGEEDILAKVGPNEPVDWLQQFVGRAKDPERVLEIYSQQPFFQPHFIESGWECDARSYQELGGDDNPTGEAENWGYDLVICFDVLNRCHDPGGLLKKVHGWLKDDGGVYIQEINPLSLPRINQTCMTSHQQVLFCYPTLLFTLFQAGFVNKMSELGSWHRTFNVKSDIATELDVRDFVKPDLWQQACFRVQRNYYWSVVTRDLIDYVQKVQENPSLTDQLRNQLRQKGELVLQVRDVCGATLLFTQEVSTLSNSLQDDWPATMNRIFNTLKNDYALYDLLKVGGFNQLGTFPGLERFHYNEKMIYMTDVDFFGKYFTQEDAAMLCKEVTNAGANVVGHLSSLL